MNNFFTYIVLFLYENGKVEKIKMVIYYCNLVFSDHVNNSIKYQYKTVV